MDHIDDRLNAFCVSSGVPPILLLMVWPCVVHFMYALVWVSPGVFFPWSKPMARVWHFRNMAYSKQLWFYGLLPWYLGLLDTARLAEPYYWRIFGQVLAQPQLVLVTGLAMLAVGCFLEVASFNAIGEAAILYGCKFGVEIEWVDNKFPYTWTNHPQHIGVALVYGSLLLFGWSVFADMLIVVAWWFCLYFFQTLVEGYLAQDEHEALKAKASKSQ
ncbi:hypothetical protein T492DRAFT_1064943 [Pavlovales sp. CCMP2436]|nr:hypothetical protein T492DRAFT_1064943 [Pavlovales sp. CCMP2436]